MSAGTVISGGFPGRVAQEVQPNQKCGGCLHYDGQAGRTGACTIGDRPWKCGDGDHPDVGYSPLVRGAGSYLPDMSNHGVHAPETHGAASTRPVAVRQVSLGEEHVHFVKSAVEDHARLQKAHCNLCSMQGTRGPAPPNVGYQLCTCAPLKAEVVAKALVSRMSNAARAETTFDGVVEWVRALAKAGFRLPVPTKPRSLGGRVIDSERRREDKALNRPKASLSDQVKIDGNGGHLRPVEKGSFSKLGNAAVHLTGVAHSDGTRQAHERALDAHKKAAAEGGPKASFHEQHVAYHQSQTGISKSMYTDDWICQFKGTPLFDEARELCERELKMEEDELKRTTERLKHEKTQRAVLDKLPKVDSEDWQSRESRRAKVRIAKQRLILKLASHHQKTVSAHRTGGY